MRPGWRVARAGGALLLACAAGVAARAQSASGSTYFWMTIAGAPGAANVAHVDGPASLARFSAPYGVAVDATGNVLIADTSNHCIRRLAGGIVTTILGAGAAGYLDGTSGVARFNGPQGLTTDAAGNLYVADTLNHTVRKVSASGTVTTIAGRGGAPGYADGAGGSGASRLNLPTSLAFDSAGNLLVVDTGNHVVRKIDRDGNVTTFAGTPTSPGSNDGSGTGARFNQPWGIAIDAAGNAFITDRGNHEIRKITPAGIVSTFAGATSSGSADGTGAVARFYLPSGIAVDSAGSVYVADTANATIRKISPTGAVTTIGGTAAARGTADGLNGAALFSAPYGLAINSVGMLYLVDPDSGTVRSGNIPQPPVITLQPQNLTVAAGVGAAFSVSATAQAALGYQWWFNGAPLAGATAGTLSVAAAQAKDAGTYAVVVTSAGVSTTSSGAVLTVNAPPAITTAPAGTTIGVGGTAVLTVTAAGSGALTFQWLRDGGAISGATSATYTATSAGNYAVVVSNPYGATTSATVRVDFPNRFVNLSARGTVGTGANALVAGLVVQAPADTRKALLIRGIGPALTGFGVDGAVPQTVLNVVDSRGTTIATNQGWFTNSNLAQLVTASGAVGAFALGAASGDSALMVNLAAGNYTVVVAPAGLATGNGMVEVYEIGADNTRIINLSTRGVVTATAGLTAGVVVQGTTSARVLVRAIGPGLVPFGVTGVLARPQLTFFNGSAVVATNAGWDAATAGRTPAETAAAAAEIAGAAAASGAFPLAAGSGDAALVVTLRPGTYTAQVSGVGGTSGVVLIEVYQVP